MYYRFVEGSKSFCNIEKIKKAETGSTYELDIRVHRRSGPGYQSSVAMMTITSDDQISSFFAIA